MASTLGSKISSDVSLSSSSTGSITRSRPFMQRCSRLHGSLPCQHNSLADHSRSSSLVIFFGARAWMAVEGAVGLDMAGRGATLVLRTSWFNCSSWIRAKKITTIIVYGCGIGCSKGAAVIGGRRGNDVYDYYGGVQQRYGVRNDCCCVQFIIGSDQDSWQQTIVAGYDVNRLQRKIAAGSFLPQGSLLATIKENGSQRLLLAMLGSERCMLRLKG
ncbi:hypothetical protein B296_00032667 [Ensete ventricosum]|uniref:Uncharacterized protein n=1 Tax=Ensete ventricosum TaxID=4639 RepID=A0A426XK59_ENSVE|nr:hypothetical protein B296_00032667 [Ensete ventricosum]